MAVTFVVNALHMLAEEAPVGGGVAEVVDSDVIVDHLMEDGVLDEFFGLIKAGVDAENEILIAYRSEEP